MRGRRPHSGGVGSVGSTEQFDTEIVHAPTQVTLSNATGITTIISNPTAATNSAATAAAAASSQQHQSQQHTNNTASATSASSTSGTNNAHSSSSMPTHDGWSIVQVSNLIY